MKIKKEGNRWVYRGVKFHNLADAEAVKNADKDGLSDINADLTDEEKDLVLLHEDGAPINFGYYVAKYTEENSITLTDLAEKLETTRQTLHAWIRGEGVPKLNSASAIIKVFGLSQSEFKQAFAGNALNALKALYKKAS